MALATITIKDVLVAEGYEIFLIIGSLKYLKFPRTWFLIMKFALVSNIALANASVLFPQCLLLWLLQ